MKVWSKRQILAHMTRVFDPHGLLGPVMMIPKLILQDLHKEKLKWDEKITPKHLELWEEWYEELPIIANIEIPRWINIKNLRKMHGYADASQVGYGAVVYADCWENGQKQLCMVASKSRVAPLKSLSIPRL